MVRHRTRQVVYADDRDTVVDDALSGAREFTISAALGRQVHDDRTWRHISHHFFSDENRRLLAWHNRCRDHHFAFRHDFAQKVPLPSVKGFVLSACVTTSVLGILGFQRKLYESSAKALYLLFHNRPQVIG